MARNELMWQRIGNSLGQILEVDIMDGEVNWDEVMRICIKLDVTKPLASREKV